MLHDGDEMGMMIAETTQNNRCRKRSKGLFAKKKQSIPVTGPHFPLRLAGEGVTVKIVGMNGGRGCHDRLAGLGLCVGAEVVVLRHSPCGKMIVGHNDTRLYLGGGMTHKIRVTVIQGG